MCVDHTSECVLTCDGVLDLLLLLVCGLLLALQALAIQVLSAEAGVAADHVGECSEEPDSVNGW